MNIKATRGITPTPWMDIRTSDGLEKLHEWALNPNPVPLTPEEWKLKQPSRKFGSTSNYYEEDWDDPKSLSALTFEELDALEDNSLVRIGRKGVTSIKVGSATSESNTTLVFACCADINQEKFDHNERKVADVTLWVLDWPDTIASPLAVVETPEVVIRRHGDPNKEYVGSLLRKTKQIERCPHEISGFVGERITRGTPCSTNGTSPLSHEHSYNTVRWMDL